MLQVLFSDSKGMNHRVGMSFVCTLLELWVDGNVKLTHDEFDQLAGFVHHLLEVAYDNRWRLDLDNRKGKAELPKP